MLALWEKTCQAEGNSKYRGPARNMSGMLDKNTWGPVSLEQSVKKLSQRGSRRPHCVILCSVLKQLASLAALCRLRKGVSSGHMQLPRFLTWLPRCGLDFSPYSSRDLWTAQRCHSPTWAWACHLQCSYTRVEPFFKHQANTCVFRGGLKSSCLLTPPPPAPACGSAALRQPDRTVWKPFCRRRGDGGYRRHKSAWV